MSFISISKLFNQTDIFVIPTFQRPYAWEVDPQVQDLLRDVSVATGKQSPFHYFGAIHTIKVEPTDPLWRNYTDPENPDIQRLSACGFRTDTTSFDVHLVVDGQQRLVTLFALLERCLTDSIRYVTLPGGQRLPKLILNPATDHAHWRALLGLGSTTARVETRSHMRLQAMFAYLAREAPKPPSKEYSFLIGNNCELMRVQLRSTSSLAPFLTLNDRGKDLTRLEKVKSLVLEADENGSYGLAHPINNRFGEIYRSIDQLDSLLGEDEYLRQLSIALWEANGFQAHYKESLDNIYLRYREQLSNQPGNAAQLVNDVVSQSAALVDEHNALVKRCSDARAAKPLGCPSYVNALFPQAPARDACDDYQRVIDSLGLQPKQLALLLAVRKYYGIDWHESLGVMRLSNRAIKQALSAEYRVMTSVAENVPEQQIKDQVDLLIDAIPDDSVRDVTPLYLAEMLRLIVGTAKPGFFNNTWQIMISNPSLSAQAFLDIWVDYLVSHSSRDNFILWSIARNPHADNQLPWLKHLLREYECCLPGGGNAHRATNLEIEHFFSSDFSAISAMSHDFASESDYKQEFVDRPGNKLMLDASLNRSFKSLLPPLNKLLPYSNGQYGSVHLAPGQFTQSSLEIAAQLPGQPNLATLRTYVMLRQLRLAVFAANRF